MSPRRSFAGRDAYQSQKQADKRFVDFVNNRLDRLCVLALAAGKSNNYIRELTRSKKRPQGYTDGMISYRGKMADVYRDDYRNGVRRPYTIMALRMEKDADFQAGLEQHLRAKLPHLFEGKNHEQPKMGRRH